jgi:hypothetical protein
MVISVSDLVPNPGPVFSGRPPPSTRPGISYLTSTTNGV